MQTVIDILRELISVGITNPFLQAGILSVISEETNFVLKPEYSYSNTSVPRLRSVFGKRLEKYTDAELEAIKKDDLKFYDIIYGGQYGNTNKGDGWKYRGRGFNQLTFKDNYKLYGNILGIDLVNNPDLVNDYKTASKVLAVYFQNAFRQGEKNGYLMKNFSLSNVNDTADFNTGVKIALQSNAGWKKDLSIPFFQEIYKKALMALPVVKPFVTSPAIKYKIEKDVKKKGSLNT